MNKILTVINLNETEMVKISNIISVEGNQVSAGFTPDFNQTKLLSYRTNHLFYNKFF